MLGGWVGRHSGPLKTLSQSSIECRFHPEPAHGTTSKFSCILPDGELVKVKYGWTQEVRAEVAASRLLTRLGFGADDVLGAACPVLRLSAVSLRTLVDC